MDMNDAAIGLMAECAKLSDADLIRELRFLAERGRRHEIRTLAHIAEFDARRLCLEEGARSAYEYCTASLGFDEGEAYRRIRAARVIRAYPAAMAALESRRVSVSALVVLSPWLQRDNVGPWLKAAEGKTRRELEALVAARYPQAPRPDAVRRLPDRHVIVSGAPPEALEAGPEAAAAVVEGPAPAVAGRFDAGWQQLAPISADRVRVGFDAACAVARLIERARQILRHKYPEGRLEDLVREAFELLLDRKDPQRLLELKAAKAARLADGRGRADASAERPPDRVPRAWAAGRYIPARVKSAVWERDEGRCAWRESDGRVCGSKDWLEYDHLRPFADGGRSDDPRNIRLLCRVHNQAAAEARFGRRGGTGEDG